MALPEIALLRVDLVRPPNAAGLEKAAAEARHLPTMRIETLMTTTS